MRPHAFTQPTDRDIINDVIVNDNRTWTIMNSIYSLTDRMTTAEMSLTGKAPVIHSHIIADTVGLQGALDGKANTVHSHPIADVTGLQAALDGKSDLSHTHAIADVTGLQAALDTKVNISGLSGYVTGASLATILGDYATNTALTTGLSGKANTSHTHAMSDVTGLSAALAGKADVSVTADLTARVVALESGPNSWTVWKANKPAKIPQVTATPTGGTVNILGIEVATGSSITSMQTAFNALKASHNSVLTLLSNREVQGA